MTEPVMADMSKPFSKTVSEPVMSDVLQGFPEVSARIARLVVAKYR